MDIEKETKMWEEIALLFCVGLIPAGNMPLKDLLRPAIDPNKNGMVEREVNGNER